MQSRRTETMARHSSVLVLLLRLLPLATTYQKRFPLPFDEPTDFLPICCGAAVCWLALVIR